MTNNREEQNIQNVKRKSLIITLLNRLAYFVYSLFTETWIGRSVMADRHAYDESAIGRFLSGEHKSQRAKDRKRRLGGALDSGAAARVFRKISSTLSEISVNVYGLFFMVYGVFSAFIYFFVVYTTQNTHHFTENRLIACVFLIICSIPFVSSPKSVCEIFGSGRLAKKIATSYFCIPEEKLLSHKRRGGAPYMLTSAALGLLLGVFSLVLSPAVVIATFFVVNIIFLIFAIPEVGLILSITALPFIQYMDFSKVALVAAVVITALAYILKVVKGNRTFTVSSAGIMVILYCIAMIIASSFSPIGAKPLVEAISVAIIVSGGYFLGANLTKKTSIRRVCIKILTISLVVLAILQFWNVYYTSISSGLEYSLNFNYLSMIDDAGINVTYNLQIPGLLAAMLSPLLIAECFRQKRIYKIVTLLLCFAPVVLSIALYGTLEIMIALLLGIALYLIFFSHKSLTSIILLLIPVVTVVLILPDILHLAGVQYVPTWTQFINFIFPDNRENSSMRSSVIADAFKMIGDGNLAGIGVGKDIFVYMFTPYASLSSEGATNAGTMYMELICESGIIGFAIFAVFVFLIVKHSLRFVITQNDRDERVTTLALLCGVVTAIFLGSICIIYGDIQMRFLFWVCAGMLEGQINTNKYNQRRVQSTMLSSAEMTDLSMKI